MPLLALQDGLRVEGVVLDSSGASVPGATVLVRPEREVGEEQTVTALDGTFLIPVVVPGTYEVEVRHPSFHPAIRKVTAGKKVSITLEIAAAREQVIVAGTSGSVEPTASENQNVAELDRQLLQDLPILDQDFLGVASLFLDTGATDSAGASLVVDGMETDDVGVSASAIEEVRVNKNPYSAEFSRPGRGRVEIRTTQGAEKLRGAVNFLIRDHRLYGRNAFAATRPPEQRRIFEGYLAGPLGTGGKTSFVVSGEREEDNQWALLFARTPAGLLQEQIEQPQRESEFSFRLTHKPNAAQTFSIRYEFENETLRNGGVGGFRLQEAGFDESERDHDILFGHSAVLGSSVIHEFRARLGRDVETTVSRRPGEPRVVVVDAFTAGGAQADRLSRDFRGELSEMISWSRGNHYLKAGIHVPDLDRRFSLDLSDRQGAFFFSSLADYRNGNPFSFTQQSGDGGVRFWNFRVAGFVQDDVRVRDNLSLGLGLRYEAARYPMDRNNLAPRLSFAYAPGKDRKTVVRGGGGIFYDRLYSGAIGDTLLFDGAHLHRVLLSFPAYPDPVSAGAGVSDLPPNIVRFDPNLRTPRLLNLGIGIERQLSANTVLAIHYNRIRGTGLYRSRDLNAPVGPDFHRPDPSVGVLRQIESPGNLTANSLNVTVRGKISQYFNGALMYTLGRTYNDTEGVSAIPAANYDLSGEWSRASFDRRHRFRAFATFRAGDLFNLGTVVRMESGSPYTMTTGRDDNRDGRAADRPAGVARNTLQGPGRAVVDLRWSKDFAMPGRGDGGDRGPTFTVAVDAFNAFNRVNFEGFVGNRSSPFFGLPVAAGSPRRLQLSLRLRF